MAKETIIIRNESLRKAALYTIGALDLEKPWKLTIERESRRRTLSQNALMWAWVDAVVGHVEAHTGHTKDEIHEWLKHRFLDPREIEINGCTVRGVRSTKNLTKAEMSEYMERIYAWATTELGLFLPIPEDLGRSDAHQEPTQRLSVCGTRYARS